MLTSTKCFKQNEIIFTKHFLQLQDLRKKRNADLLVDYCVHGIKSGWNSDIKAIHYDICGNVANYYNRTVIFEVLPLILVCYWTEYKKICRVSLTQSIDSPCIDDCDDIMVSDKLKRLSASPVNPQWSGAMAHTT